MVRLRSATESDAPAIRKLIWQARINPMSLNWKRFVVAVDQQEKIIGCVQIKSHYDGTNELASLVVQPEHRGQGIARMLIEQMLIDPPNPLYLTCRSSLEHLYEKFGFSVLPPERMPPYFYRLWRLVRILTFLSRRSEMMLVMVRT
jgi:N-acetylglutamate synthase-like GNAT family acetyltransferase